MNKLIVICGPTATGKTKLGLHVAKMLNGEIVSADSRQVYKYMDIGTGKDNENSEFTCPPSRSDREGNCRRGSQNLELEKKIRKQINDKISVGNYEIRNVVVWGLDLVKPNQEFSVAHWVKFSTTIINNIWNRNKLPIIVGGSGFWIKTLIDGVDSMGIPPNWELRKRLSKSNIDELVSCLKKINPIKYEQMNNSDRNNPRRLIRAIEIAYQIKNHLPTISCRPGRLPASNALRSNSGWQEGKLKIETNDLLIIGLMTNHKSLYELIDQRVEKRIAQGMEREIRKLLNKGYDWSFTSMNTPGYKEWKNYFNKKIDLNEIIKQWKYNEHKLARNQLTWFKKDKRIIWFDIEKSNHKEIANDILRWYTEKR